jgi:uncharacterized protein YjbJ (UPF0337 family)
VEFLAVKGGACRPGAGNHPKENLMSMNKDQVRGRVEQAKGSVKEAAGKVVGDKTLEAQGNIQKNIGKIQRKFGDLKQDVKDSQK